MPNYAYSGRNQGGSLVSGDMLAASADEVVSELLGRKITPININEARSKKQAAAKPGASNQSAAIKLFNKSRIDTTDLILFSRQMYSLTKAGLPLDRALRGLGASINNLAMKTLLKDVEQQLERGMDLTGALSRHPKVFSTLYLALVHVGENTGRLDLAFQQVGKYLELERNTSKQIKSATRYPLFVLVAISIALGIITTFVIPVFAETFQQLQAELPWQTVVLISVSDFVVAWWYLILGGIGALVAGFMYWVKSPEGLRTWDRHKLRFALIGTVFERVALSRFSRTFAMMMKAGVPIVQSLSVVARAVGNQHISDSVLRMRDGISHGDSLYITAVKSNMFSPLVLQMIAVGEEGGNVDDLLEEAADFYDAEVEYDVKKLGAAIEPILIVCIAGMVLVLALGVFLPIWDLASAAK